MKIIARLLLLIILSVISFIILDPVVRTKIYTDQISDIEEAVSRSEVDAECYSNILVLRSKKNLIPSLAAKASILHIKILCLNDNYKEAGKVARSLKADRESTSDNAKAPTLHKIQTPVWKFINSKLAAKYTETESDIPAEYQAVVDVLTAQGKSDDADEIAVRLGGTKPSEKSSEQTSSPLSGNDSISSKTSGTASSETASAGKSESKADWCVVKKENSPVYNRSGDTVLTLPVSKLLQIRREVQSSAGNLYECVIQTTADRKTTGFIKASHVIVSPTPFASASYAEKNLRKSEATILSSLETAQKDMKKGLNSNNPHLQEYKTASTSLARIQKKAKKLKVQRDSAKGAKKAQISEALQKMKNETILLRDAYFEAKNKYEGWNDDHPNASPDSTINSLEKKLADVRSKINSL